MSVKIDYKKMKKLRLENHEKERGWTQGEVAKKVGVSGQTYRQWEWGQCSPSEDNYEKLSWVFGDDLMPDGKSDDK